MIAVVFFTTEYTGYHGVFYSPSAAGNERTLWNFVYSVVNHPTLQRYNLRNAMSSFRGGFFCLFLFGKADFRNIQKVAGNREGDAVFVLKFSLFLGSGGGGGDRFQRFQFSVSWFADARLEQ